MPESDLSGRAVLVTGANGFIGAHLTAALLQAGADVHAMVRAGSSMDRLDRLQTAPRIVGVDLTDHAATRDAVHRIRPEFVFHLAVSRQTGDWDRLLAVNVAGAMNLLRASGEIDCRRFVSLGSALERIDPATGTAANDYGASRAAAGILLRQHAREHRIPLACLRTDYVYGPLQGEGKLIPTALRHAARGSAMPLAPSTARRDYVHVSDVVSACRHAAQAHQPDQFSAEIATGRLWSVAEVIALVAELTGADLRTEPGSAPARAWDTHRGQPDTETASPLPGWSATMDLRAGLLDLISHDRSGREG
ncbi:nucleoside-diphosphate-sugar epimerase [Hoeflea marina]|uniref:Nucleoside-diphosphate-sugar epimerase n=1 Tax=Hoeflea marina TaxID=274592 RepID=A0A317PHZ6_9HYPH|nr:NAD(P)-dependent oxidoreductase [Hoeflea marina]PWV99058.1 nucleoside-diphosphate-sugar epimerase [Hoeflea marina]